MESENKELLQLLAKEGTIAILNTLKLGNARFSDLEGQVKHSTLAKRLKELEEKGLIKRKVVNLRPPRTEYSITDLGKRSLSMIKQLREPHGE